MDYKGQPGRGRWFPIPPFRLWRFTAALPYKAKMSGGQIELPIASLNDWIVPVETGLPIGVPEASLVKGLSEPCADEKNSPHR